MGKSYRDTDFLDHDEQVNAEFYENVEAISTEEFVRAADTAATKVEVGEEITGEETVVSVRFDSDGYAYEYEPKSRRAKPTYSEPLELIPNKLAGLSQYGQDFAEVITRSQEFAAVSKLNVIRWAHHGDGRRVSELPSPCDWLCDVQIVARRVLSPALFKIWKEIYFDGYGEHADCLPIETQITIQQRCSAAWKKAGLIPFAAYWNHPTPESKLGIAVDLLQRVDEEQRQETKRAADNKKRRERRSYNGKRNRNRHKGVRTLAVAA